MGWTDRIAGKEDGRKQDEKHQKIRHGEEAPVDQPQHRALAPPWSDVVGVDGAVGQVADARQAGAQSLEP